MTEPRLERYEIISELGQGGMSVVYRARDKQLSRDVALKVLHDFLAKQSDARRRFHREAVAVAKLHHPGILEIFDYSGPGAEQSYIVTELIEGLTLRELVEANGPPRFPELGALITAELVRALRHAHEQGVVHRDLKPENIMVTRTGQLKLMDFGIAQIMGGATKLTATGTLLGSPAHMAPEVIDGKASDHRSDIFSVGTILYWLTTGTLPFAAPNPSALFRRILEGRYEPAQMIAPKIGNRLARIIDHALALDPEDRYQDISELEAELEAELIEVGLTPPEVKVKAMLASPISFADAFEPELVATLATAGEEALAENHVARAMDCFNRVLAIDPHHERVKALVARVGRRERLTRGVRRVAVVALLSLMVGGGAYGAVTLYPRLTDRPATAAVLVKPTEPIAKTAAAPKPPTTVAMAPAVETSTATIAAPPKKQSSKRPVRHSNIERHSVVAARPGLPKLELTPAPEVAVVRAQLRVKIQHWANIRIDDKVTEHVANRLFELSPGEHVVEIIWPGAGPVRSGRYPKRRYFVDEAGKLFELKNGAKQPSPGLIEVKIPRNETEAADCPGWTWT